MRTSRAILLVLIVSAVAWLTNCSRTQTTAHGEPTQISVPPKISQKMLNSLLRPKDQKTRPEPKAMMWVHKVRHRRETFFSIAGWYTGSGKNWPRLAEANPDIDPKCIHIGDTILIPEDLIKTHRPMPAGRPNPKRKHRKIENPQQPSIHPPAEDEEVTLFGPIVNDFPPAETERSEPPLPLETIDR